MAGHRARPLHLATPFYTASSESSGCVASLAGGDDGTIRFWRVFQPVNTSHTRARQYNAIVEGATTREDIQSFQEPNLR
ncbi:hypothetical protein AGDE_14267 [Angomonas deanei]|uniref:WD domain, G-beta repeat n=1 Tax=Angomonas deanei TaxID=59799 RepID=A0A7G2C5A8_9TRYP|nr:hypothetical protein AGDE_14267 [Angomonas deanei]CAD2214334.1 hypothetical protein, conserved [Angomonas deanei]|eukprot:EPY21150.1 hypothetical protein AGDE_14267 [Angomonas deanei]